MLSSTLFRSDARLQAASANPSLHVVRGDAGRHVSRLHLALLLLGHNSIDGAEWRGGAYGASTAATVLAYKRARDIVNRAYQQQADDIVGVMTLARLDAELCGLERLLPMPAQRRPQDRWRDSATMFELRRGVSMLRRQPDGAAAWSVGGPADAVAPAPLPVDPATVGTVVSASQDMADEFVSILASSGDPMVGPRSGGDRERICQLAIGRTADLGKPFDTPEVRRCWAVVDPPSTPPTPVQVHWCGIYASNLWRESGLADIRWITRFPWGVVKGGAKLRSSHNLFMLAPGDILINDQPTLGADGKPVLVDGQKQYAFHHVLILKISPDRRFADILQGNSGPYPKHQSLVTRDMHHPLPRLTTRSVTHEFISVDTVMHPGVHYG